MSLYSIEPLSERLVELIKSSTENDVIYIDRSHFLEAKDEHSKVTALICRDRDDVAEIVKRCTNLSFLYIVSAGVEKLPFELLRERRIVVANAGGVNAEIMSQYAMAYILSQSARVCENLDNQRQRHWKRFQCVDDLSGKKLLVVGAGRVGSLLAHKASVFGMGIVGIKNKVCPVAGFDKIVGLDELDGELPEADFVVCALPLTTLTKRLFNRDRFSLMKSTATFINISRGGLVDEAVLVEALHNGLIKSAVLDVFDNEPLDSSSPLWGCPGLYVTPHSSGRLENFMDAAITQFTVNYNAYLAGGSVPNNVDLSNCY